MALSYLHFAGHDKKNNWYNKNVYAIAFSSGNVIYFLSQLNDYVSRLILKAIYIVGNLLEKK